MAAARPMFRPVVGKSIVAKAPLPGGSVASPFVYRLTSVDASEAPTTTTWVPQPGSETKAAVEPDKPEQPDMIEQERNKYMVDFSQPYLPANPFLKTMTPLDAIAARLPALPDRVKKALWTPFVPDAFAPTEWLKDVPPPYGPKPKRFLDLKNGHPLDDRIVFIGGVEGIDESGEEEISSGEKNEPHRYYFNGSCANIISCTTFLKAFFEPFDALTQSESTFRTKTFADCKHRPSYKYYGCKSPADIRAVWKRNARLGTLMHANLEAHFNGEPFTVLKENIPCFQQFQALFNDTDWVQWEPFRTEWSVCDPETLIAGQIDLAGLVNRERGELVLIDWKRAENISDCSFARFKGASQNVGGCGGHGPCQVLEDCNFVLYSLQLCVYAYILHKCYGFRTVKMFILQFHPKNNSGLAGVYQAPNLAHIVEEMFAARKIVLREHGIQTQPI